MIPRTLLLALCFFSLLACCKTKNEKPFEYVRIDELVRFIENESEKNLAILRLAVAKTVARSLRDTEVRHFIYDRLTENTDKYFNELLLSDLISAKVTSEKTFGDYLNEAIDDEIKSLFGEDLISKAIAEDPMLVIKIPDVYYHTSFQLDDYAPLVYAETYSPIKTTNTEHLSWVGYHYSGFQDLQTIWEKPKYFPIVVKYSRDYLLINTQTAKTYRDFAIHQMIPQIKDKCLSEIRKKLFATGIQYTKDQEFRYIKRKTIFDLATTNCEQQRGVDSYDFSSCHLPCERDCFPADSLGISLKGMYASQPIWRLGRSSINYFIFRDNIDLLLINYVIKIDSPAKVFDAHMITGYRVNDFLASPEYKVTIGQNEHCIEQIGKVTLAYSHFIALEPTYSKISLRHVVENRMDTSYLKWRSMRLLLIEQSDFAKYLPITQITLGNRVVNLTHLTWNAYNSLGTAPYDYCMPHDFDFHFGNIFTLNFSY